MGEEKVSSIESSLDKQIEKQKNPTSVTVTLDNWYTNFLITYKESKYEWRKKGSTIFNTWW